MSLTFAEFIEKNRERNILWAGDHTPSLEFRVVELMGEVGELANNLKKNYRYKNGMKGGSADTQNRSDEVADIFISLALLADDLNTDLEKAIIQKFNATSEKYDFNIFLGVKEPEKINQAVATSQKIIDSAIQQIKALGCDVEVVSTIDFAGKWTDHYTAKEVK